MGSDWGGDGVGVLEMVVDFGGNIMKKMRIFCMKFKLYIEGCFFKTGHSFNRN